jgi:hypothetical protein
MARLRMHWWYIKWWLLWNPIDGILSSNNDLNELDFFNQLFISLSFRWNGIAGNVSLNDGSFQNELTVYKMMAIMK